MPAQSKPVVPKPQQLTPFGAALAGALGGCFSNAVVYPLDVAKTRIQAATTDAKAKGKGKPALSMSGMLVKIIQEEGIQGYYKGFGATMLNTFSMQYAYFFFYSVVRTSYIKRLVSKGKPGAPAPTLSTAAELLLGAVAGALAQIFTIPVSVIATRQQVGRSDGDRDKAKADGETPDDSFVGVAREIIKEDGVTGLWLGLRPGLVLTVNPAITYGVYERVKSAVLLAKTKAGADDKMGAGLAFLVGALSKTLATVVTYPYIFAKVRIQARSNEAPDEESLPTIQTTTNTTSHLPPPTAAPAPRKELGALDILLRVWQRDGFKGWYQGMSAQITKAVLSQALLFMSKDAFEGYALAIMIFWARLSARSKGVELV